MREALNRCLCIESAFSAKKFTVLLGRRSTLSATKIILKIAIFGCPHTRKKKAKLCGIQESIAHILYGKTDRPLIMLRIFGDHRPGYDHISTDLLEKIPHREYYPFLS